MIFSLSLSLTLSVSLSLSHSLFSFCLSFFPVCLSPSPLSLCHVVSHTFVLSLPLPVSLSLSDFLSFCLCLSFFSSFLTAYFYLTGHSPVSIYNTALLYIVLALCGHLQTQRVCRALHPVSGEDEIIVAEVSRRVQHASSARTSTRRVVGLARPIQSAGRALP